MKYVTSPVIWAFNLGKERRRACCATRVVLQLRRSGHAPMVSHEHGTSTHQPKSRGITVRDRSAMLRGVVITGLGLLTPLGCGVETSWSRLIAGQSGARRIEEFPVDDLACQIGCFVPRGPLGEGKFNPDDWMEPKEQRKVDDFIIYGMAAAQQAIEDAG